MERVFSHFKGDAEFLFRSFSAASSDYFYVWDLEKDTFLVSENMAEDFALPDVVLTNYMDKWMARINQRDGKRIRKAYEEFLLGREDSLNVEYQIRTASNKYIWVSSRGSLQRNPNTGQPLLLAGVLHNLEYDGKIDSVTGLFGTEKCREDFEVMTSNLLDYSGSVMLIGIDEFSSINTLNSHTFGDLVLRTSAQDIQKLLPENACLYRFDGDQFVICGYKMKKEDMVEIYNQICSYGISPHELGSRVYRFTVSAGMITFPDHGCTWSDLEIGASIALKKAKENGKNQYVEFTKEMLIEKLHEQSLSRLLLESVNSGYPGFWPVFQPVCDASTLNVIGAEILLRFDTPEGITISPLEFIPILESTQLIIPVGMWVLERAIVTCKKWIEHIPEFVMNVNISYMQLRDTKFCDKVQALLHKYGVGTKHLALELTESYFITDAPNIEASLKGLRNLKMQLAMDDFGTGYSSLARLAQFNVDVVKIDRMFVQALHKSKYNQEFVESVVKLCHNVGMRVCVEGVETVEEQRSISLLDVDYIQGFYVSRPIDEKGFFAAFVETPFDGRQLIALPDNEMRHHKLVSDRDLLMALMDATPLCLNLWSRNIEIMACNEEVLRLFKVDGFENFQNNFFQFSPQLQPDGQPSKKKAWAMIKEAFEKGRSTFFWMHCNKKGEEIPTEVTSVRIPYQNDAIVVSYTRDLRPQLAGQKAERMAAERIEAVIDATPLTCILWNMEGRAIDCNQVAVNMYGAKDKAEVLNNFEAFSPDNQPDGSVSRQKRKEKFAEARKNGSCIYEWMYRTRNHEEVPCEVTLVRILAESEDIIVAYARDLRELHKTLELNKRLSKIAYYDVLTGSMSRASLIESLQKRYWELKKNDLFALLIFDVDFFKNVNDTYGHNAGDMALRMVVGQAMSHMPKGAKVGRYGGDEFVILIEGIDRDCLQELMNRFIASVAQTPILEGDSCFSITVSVGGAYFDGGDSDWDQLIKRADRALYEAKG